MFITIEYDTGTANLLVSPMVFEQHRRAVWGVSTMSIHGKPQREGEVGHSSRGL